MFSLVIMTEPYASHDASEIEPSTQHIGEAGIESSNLVSVFHAIPF